MKRLGIFLFNNQNGIVDEYIQFLLDDIAPNLSHLCVIVNDNKLDVENTFEKYTNDIFVNSGQYNINIWKEVIVNHFGFDYLVEFDEIILFDDSFFGPIYSFKEIFDNIEDIDLDLWTILSNGVDDGLNAFDFQFIAFRKNLIQSEDFREFWLNIDVNAFKDRNNENYLIDNFSKLGFKWKNYSHAINNLEVDEREQFFAIFDIYNYIIDYKLPLINIKPFTLPKKIQLYYHNGLDLSLTMKYLNYETDYDASLIYKYLLTILDPNALVNLLNLKEIIPIENLNADYKSDKSIVVIAHLYYDDILDYDFKFLSNIPDYIDIIITTDNIDKKSLIEENYLSKLENNSKVILVSSRGRDMSGLFVGCKDEIRNYDYFCYVHDKKSSYNDYYVTGNSFRDIIWENMLASEDYINSIIKSFDDNESLGLIVPPRVYHSTYFTAFYHNYWLGNVDEIYKLFDKMNIDAEINSKELPLPIGNCFWAKFDALKPLFDLDWDYEDFPPEPLPHDGTVSHALERIYAHVAASHGYFTEIAMTDYYGSNDITNYPYMLSEVSMVIQNRFDKKLKFFSSFNDVLKRFIDNLNKLDKTIVRKDKKIGKLEEDIKTKDEKINEIMNSNSWKTTKPLRMTTFKLKNLKRK